MIFALREPATVGALDGLPRLSIEGLDEPDARALLSRVPGRLDDRIRNRIVSETGGNPLALVELSHEMSRAERASGFALPSAGDDLPSRMEERYLRRVIDLPEPTQRLLLLAAAGPLGDAALVWRAADRLSIEPSNMAPATEAGLLEIDDDRTVSASAGALSGVSDRVGRRRTSRPRGALEEASDPELAADAGAWARWTRDRRTGRSRGSRVGRCLAHDLSA